MASGFPTGVANMAGGEGGGEGAPQNFDTHTLREHSYSFNAKVV